MYSTIEIVCVVVFLVLAVMPGLYGLHLAVLAVLAHRRRDEVRPAQDETIADYVRRTPEAQWPRVTTQLPLYNELAVARRVIEAACAMDYPAGRHEVQVLDDSTDETREIVDEACERLRARGHDVTVVRRSDRKDFKAGALAYGLKQAKGEFVAVFDADFVPDPQFLRRMVPLLASSPEACCVQGRWAHLNQHESWTTEALALAMDGHFAVEQPARAWNGFLLNFNGTGGIWRRSAIDDPGVGGWSGDTITEDLDLSYRAQMVGWKIIYRLDEACPAEIPGSIDAMKTQQRRWATGSIQCARKLLPLVWRCPRLSLLQKIEGSIHLTQYSISVYMVLMAGLARVLLDVIPWELQRTWLAVTWMFLPFFFAAPSLTYIYGRWGISRGWSGAWHVPKLIIMGLGLSVNNAYAVLVGLVQKGGEFIRTPKSGSSGAVRRQLSYKSIRSKLWLLEMSLGVACLFQWAVFLQKDHYIGNIWVLLYAIGFITMGWGSRPWLGKAKPAEARSEPALKASPSGVAA